MTRQLSLVFGNRHGGRRKGAGRKPKGAQAGVGHRPRVEFARRRAVMVTQRFVASCPSLRRGAELALFRRLVVKLADDSFAVVHWSLQSNHVHLLCEAETSVVLARRLGGFFARLARLLNAHWKRSGRVFADRFESRVLASPTEVRHALVYTLNNARKHGAWRGRGPDTFSSGFEFDGWSDWVAQSRVLPAAKTWILNVGWRKLGALSVREAPRSRDEFLEQCWRAEERRVRELRRTQRPRR